MKPLSAHRKKTVRYLTDSLLSGAIVLYATYMIRDFEASEGMLSGLFLLLAAENGVRPGEGRHAKTKRVGAMALYLLGALLILVLNPFHSSLLAAAVIELAVLLFNRVTAILNKPSLRVIALNVLCILIIAAAAAFVFGSDLQMNRAVEMNEAALAENPEYAEIAESLDQTEITDDAYSLSGQDVFLSICLMFTVLMRIVLHVVGISISQMKLRVLMNIVRETYVLEVLLGLLLMIIVCATMFSTLEESMSGYGDALWYCFALVTTIGFGDITAKTAIGRILSVLLGIYGIVVVAIITSVIVNFYGEMRRMSGQNPDTEDGSLDGEA